MKKWLYIICLLLITTALYSYERISMLRIEFEDNSDLPTGTSYLACMLGLSVLSLLFSRGARLEKSMITSKFTKLILWVYFISILFSSAHPFTKANYILIILPLLLLLFTSLYFIYLKTDKVIVWCMTVIALALLVNYLVGMADVFGVKRSAGSYYVIYFLPFMLCHNNNIVRIICVIVAFAVAVLSIKLGGVLSVASSVVVYMLVKQNIERGKRYSLRTLIIIIAIAVLLMCFLLYIDENVLGGMFLEHWDESQSSGGSGRLEIYSIFLKMIYNSNILNFIFGHGWLGSEYESSIGLTCHNDFLETFVDFGLIGFLLYVIFHFSLYLTCKRMIRLNFEYAPVMCASVVMFFINSMLAHVFIYPWYLMIFTLFWGFIISKYRLYYIKRII